MIKGIGKNITKKEERNVLDETRDFYMKINESEADSKYDCDMSPLERLASEGVTYVAERIAKGFVDAVDDIIFSKFAASPPVVDKDVAAATMVWKYVGELAFNMLVLVGAVKMSDRISHEIFTL